LSDKPEGYERVASFDHEIIAPVRKGQDFLGCSYWCPDCKALLLSVEIHKRVEVHIIKMKCRKCGTIVEAKDLWLEEMR
jgi:ssDNA-binding Zn-finger/Zn-ribbon topoisomerase 1